MGLYMARRFPAKQKQARYQEHVTKNEPTQDWARGTEHVELRLASNSGTYSRDVYVLE